MEVKRAMKQPEYRLLPVRLICMTFLICVILLSCGLTGFATGESLPDLEQAATPPADVTTPMPPPSEDTTVRELYPADVQTIITDTGRQIIKTYMLTAGQSPDNIPRDGFCRDGWRYEITDITEKRVSNTDTRSHVETVELNTDTKNLNEIIKLLAPSLDYQDEDGYCGVLALDMASVSCEAAGYKNKSYTVSATREYPHLSANDLSLIPKTITDNGKTLELDGVTWDVQHYVNVDHADIPDSYRAVAKYSTKASKTTVIGYITTADYSGEVSRTVFGDAVYTAYFSGTDMTPVPKPTEPTEPTTTMPTTTRSTTTQAMTTTTTTTAITTTATPVTTEPMTTEPAATPTIPKALGVGFPIVPLLTILAILTAIAGAGAYWYLLRHNVKIYTVSDGRRVLTAKDKISAKRLTVNLTPLEGRCFTLEIDKFTANSLNGKTIEVLYGPSSLKHRIAYEGNVYLIEADFGNATIQAIY